jgi:hypothetical protein
VYTLLGRDELLLSSRHWATGGRRQTSSTRGLNKKQNYLLELVDKSIVI